MAEELENKPVENNAQNNAQAEVTPEDVQNNKAFFKTGSSLSISCQIINEVEYVRQMR